MQTVYEDKTLVCRDCGTEFIWTSGEQAFFASKGLTNQPGRCSACRTAARMARGAGGVAVSVAPGRPREYFPVVCDRCGTQAQVPFLPRNDKPVYCSSCYDAVRAERVSSYAQ